MENRYSQADFLMIYDEGSINFFFAEMDNFISELLKDYHYRGETSCILFDEIYNKISKEYINQENVTVNSIHYIEVEIENTCYKIFKNFKGDFVYSIVQTKNGITIYFIISLDIVVLFNTFLNFIFSSLISLTRSKLLKLNSELFINK